MFYAFDRGADKTGVLDTLSQEDTEGNIQENERYLPFFNNIKN